MQLITHCAMDTECDNEAFNSQVPNEEVKEPPHDTEVDQKEDVKAEEKQSILIEFCEETTGHGFLKLVETKNIIRKIWIAILILTSIGLLVHLALLLVRYFQFGVNTAFYRTQDNQIVMPDITVCPLAKFAFTQYYSESGAQPFTPDVVTVTNNNLTFQALFDHYVQLWSTMLGNQSDVNIARYSIMKTAYEAKVLRNQNEIIIKLNYKMNNVNVSTIMETAMVDGSICATFSPQINYLNFTNGADDTILMVSTRTIGDSDSYELATRALKELNNYRVGFIIYLHASGTMPDMYSDIQEMPITSLQSVSFSQTNILRCEVNNNCISNPPPITLRGFSKGQTKSYQYSRYLCSQVQRSIALYSVCRCRSELLLTSTSVPDTAPFCHAIPDLMNMQINGTFLFSSDLTAIADVSNGLIQRHLCHDQQLTILASFNFSSVCIPNCVETTYDFDVASMAVSSFSTSLLPTYVTALTEIQPLLAAQNVSSSLINNLMYVYGSAITRRVTFVRISPGTVFVEVAADSLTYPLGTYFSDVGGIFGLYLGFSVISILELFELLFQWLVVNRGSCYKAKKE